MPKESDRIKAKSSPYRRYPPVGKVQQTYAAMHTNQTRGFCAKTSGKAELTSHRASIEDVFKLLDKIIDESDPDSDLAQTVHAYQTAESIKRRYFCADGATLKQTIDIRLLFSDTEWETLPSKYKHKFASKKLHEIYADISDWSWFPLVGYIHDLGKVLTQPFLGSLPQWAVVGDTFPVGAPFSKANVYYDQEFYKSNPDLAMPTLNGSSLFGIYRKKCGFDKVTMSWGHDEYLHRVLTKNTHSLPPEALYIIRFHSFYPWHSPRNGERGYTNLASERDWLMLPLLKAFQKADLYSKTAKIPNASCLKQYYANLSSKFISGRDATTASRYNMRPAKLGW